MLTIEEIRNEFEKGLENINNEEKPWKSWYELRFPYWLFRIHFYSEDVIDTFLKSKKSRDARDITKMIFKMLLALGGELQNRDNVGVDEIRNIVSFFERNQEYKVIFCALKEVINKRQSLQNVAENSSREIPLLNSPIRILTRELPDETVAMLNPMLNRVHNELGIYSEELILNAETIKGFAAFFLTCREHIQQKTRITADVFTGLFAFSCFYQVMDGYIFDFLKNDSDASDYASLNRRYRVLLLILVSTFTLGANARVYKQKVRENLLGLFRCFPGDKRFPGWRTYINREGQRFDATPYGVFPGGLIGSLVGGSCAALTFAGVRGTNLFRHYPVMNNSLAAIFAMAALIGMTSMQARSFNNAIQEHKFDRRNIASDGKKVLSMISPVLTLIFPSIGVFGTMVAGGYQFLEMVTKKIQSLWEYGLLMGFGLSLSLSMYVFNNRNMGNFLSHVWTFIGRSIDVNMALIKDHSKVQEYRSQIRKFFENGLEYVATNVYEFLSLVVINPVNNGFIATIATEALINFLNYVKIIDSSDEDQVRIGIWLSLLVTATVTSEMFSMVPYEERERIDKAFSDSCKAFEQRGVGPEQIVEIPEEPQARSQFWSESLSQCCFWRRVPITEGNIQEQRTQSWGEWFKSKGEWFRSKCCLWGQSSLPQPAETTSLVESGQQQYGTCELSR